MTDDLDELLELTPTHASVLLVDPVELADRAGRSARGARRRANGVVAGMATAGVLIAVAIGSMFVRPMFAMPAASTSPVPHPYPSATPMSSFVPMNGGDEAADYSAPRVAIGKLTGAGKPDTLCLDAARSMDLAACVASVPVTGLTWAQIPWASAPTGTMTADAAVWGYFDGKTFTATTASAPLDTTISLAAPDPSPAPPTAALITCDRVLAGTGSGLEDGLGTQPGIVAHWFDSTSRRLMVAVTGDLDEALLTVQRYWDGAACIGTVPATGPLADLLDAAQRLRDAKIDGVVSVAAADQPSGVLQINVLANVPGLRERVVAVVGDSVSITIVPLIVTVT